MKCKIFIFKARRMFIKVSTCIDTVLIPVYTATSKIKILTPVAKLIRWILIKGFDMSVRLLDAEYRELKNMLD